MRYVSTKIIPMGSTAFRQWKAQSHCRLIHGYRLQCKLWFSADSLDDNNWVYDFGGLKELKSIFNNQFDHTLIIAGNDIHRDTFITLGEVGAADVRIMEGGVGIEKFAEWCFDIADHLVGSMTKNRCWVDRVEVFEHENNSAIYTNNITTTMRFADHTEEDNG